MNKNQWKNVALRSRRQLLAAVRQRAEAYGVGEQGEIGPCARVLTASEQDRRQKLVEEIHRKGYEAVMEDTAVFWFIRFMALRLLEVKGFLPPKEPAQGDWLINQCRRLSDDFPQAFEKIPPWMELLFPSDWCHPDRAVCPIATRLDEADFQEVEIIGWLYQFYFSEKHQAVIDPLHGKVISKEDIPVATQVFTTQWVVRYLVDNSLGRYWLQAHPGSRLSEKLRFLMVPKEGWPVLTEEPPEPEALKVLDPCAGAGHFLSYAFDVLMEIYREWGRSDEDAVRSILKNNLYGLDIDNRVVGLACFALTVKAMQYYPGVLQEGLAPRILAMQDSDSITDGQLDTVAPEGGRFRRDLGEVVAVFRNAKEFGSLISVPELDYGAMAQRLRKEPLGIAQRLLCLARQGEILAGTYHAVATNPPYLNKYSPALKNYLVRHFAPYKGDLFSVFTVRSLALCKAGGYCGLMTPMVWMFIKSYEGLRRYLLSQKSMVTLIQFAYSAFEDATVPLCAFVLHNEPLAAKGMYVRLWDFPGGMEVQRQKFLEALTNPDCGYCYEVAQGEFSKLPTVPFAYWLSPEFRNIFDNPTLGSLATPCQGLATGCNDRFVRWWYEVSDGKICYDAGSVEEAARTGKKWFPYNKGGEFRKWYGNQEYVVNWEHDGFLIRNFRDNQGKLRSRPQNTRYYFRESISWSLISSATVAFRYQPRGHIFDVAGMSCFADRHLKYLLGLCNSPVAGNALGALAPTINFQAGDIANLPVILQEDRMEQVEALVQQNIEISKEDWDAFETSWEFRKHPLLCMARLIADRYRQWEARCEARFRQLKENEEALNRIFIEIYGLQGELSPRVEDSAVTVRRADLQREIKSLISYAVGCLFGRYSHHTEGLLYAGGDWKKALEKLHTIGPETLFLPKGDNILPLCEGPWGDEDLAGGIFRWVEAVYGKETLEENLQFMADGLGGSGTAREVIRHYLFHDFYADHLKTYRNRPIYWLFSSGKKKGFQALIYMHRYQPELPERMRTHYVHRQQADYRARMAALETVTPDQRMHNHKQRTKLEQQALEVAEFEERLRRLGAQMISIDPDDGVPANYGKFQEVVKKLAP